LILSSEVDMPSGRQHQRVQNRERTKDLFGDELVCDPLFFERRARSMGFIRIAGLDEAGRGPLAGPVVAAAVMLSEGRLIPGVTDSKKITPPERERLFFLIQKEAVSFGIGVAGVDMIDSVNILQATIIAMEQAVQSLAPGPDYLLIDALTLPRIPLPQNPLIKGDFRSHSIAAASILAKVTRDRLMAELHEKFPEYNFHAHKGYGTKEHLNLLEKHGPCEAHRKTFEPVARILREALQ
jgi:ribonuclease HII